MTRPTTGRSTWRRPLALTSAALAALALTACSPSTVFKGAGENPGPRVASDVSLTSAWQQSTYTDLYKQKIAWRPCTEEDGLTATGLEAAKEQGITAENFDCARVQAPMNWADPEDERTTELAVMRLRSKASDAAAGSENGKGGKPLFINPGGPGLTASSLALDLAKQATFGTVLKEYDVYAVDPRGVGASSPLGCQSSSTIPARRLSECIAKNPLARYMGTSQVARDMEMMRSLTGAERFDYLGYSYGTVLGSTYATLFPGNAGRMVLDSALAGDWAHLTTGFDQQVALSAEIDAMIASTCADGTTCPFTDTEGLLALRDSLDASPWKGSDGAELSGGMLVQFLVDTLYKSPAERAQRLSVVKKAAGGAQADIDELLILAGISSSPADKPADGGQSGADGAQSGAPEAPSGPLFDPTGEVITCHSAMKTPDVAGLVEHMKKTGVPALIGGPEVNDKTIDDFVDLRCAVLPEVGTDFNTSFHAPNTKTPILVIGTKGDHATPYAFSERLVEQLGNARLLTFDAHGHGLSFGGRSPLLDRTIADYLVNGTLPAEGTTIADGADQ
ncbi:MAG: alpha/beta fold hydrolase [Schaalia hyovaginalis]|uniref:alpha/beta hydrolase n=1 Tax=Schaalia hyovaginalis TaxID=29316 RepID=UPI0023F7AFD1|nr:alpha/beta hydrolase [Schaalia hyovaginalis]MCI7671929.1 alpha/beta hydrolase [Schaalia hyovaginalis]MDY5506462.1 alpha/beta fold hydrolase [Schaalia hyovaginalis]